MSGIQQGLLASLKAAGYSLLTGLISYYKVDGNSTDSVGSDNGTDTNVTYTSGGNNGKINQGANFVGTGGINLSTTNTLTNNFSFAFWFNSTGITSFQGLFAKGLFATNTDSSWWIVSGIPASAITFSVFSGSTEYRLSTAATLSNNTWYHCACTYDGATMKTYINAGTPVTRAASGNINNTTNPVALGRLGGYAGLYYSGAIDEIGIWSRAITASEVTSLYNGGAGIQYPF